MNVLAEGVVQFVAQGVEKIDGAVNRVFSVLAKFTKQGGAAVDKFMYLIKRGSTAVRDFAASSVKSMGQAAGSLTLFGVAVSGAIGAFVAKASSGTVEGDRFALSLKRLTMVLGDQLGPYLRQTTALINQASNAIARIDPATRNWITGLVLAGGALITAGLALSRMTGFLSPLTVGLKLIPIALQVVTTAISATISLIGLLGGAVGAAITPFLGIAAAVALAGAALIGLGAIFAASQGQALSFGSVLGGVYEILADLVSVFYVIGETILGEVVGALMSLGKTFLGVYTDYVAPAVSAIGEAIMSIFPFIRPVVESINSTWKWLTDNITVSWKGAVRFIGDIFLGMVLLISQGINGIGKIFGYAAAGIIDTLTTLGETVGVISKGYAAAMREMAEASRNLQLIDEEKLTSKLGGASNKIGGMLKQNTEDAKALGSAIDAGIGSIKAPAVPEFKLPKVPELKVPDAVMKVAQDQIKRPRDTRGLTQKMDVTFEGLTGTFDRLQKAFATNPGQSVEESQLKELQIGNQLQGQVVQAVNKLQPAVGP